MRAWLRTQRSDLFVAGISLLAAMLVRDGVPLAFRLPLGALAVLVLPGYALTAAAFPHRLELTLVERVGLAIGLSLAINALVALGLDRSPWGLNVASVVTTLTLVTLVAIAAAVARRRHDSSTVTPIEQRTDSLPPAALAPGRLDRTARRIAAALAGTAALVSTSLLLALCTPAPPPTEFYVLGPAGLTEAYPQTVRAGATVTVTIGVTNHSGEAADFIVRVHHGEATLGTLGPVAVPAGGTIEVPCTFTAPLPGRDQRITLALQRTAGATPLRQLHLWLDVTP
jgi:uncharacterized membrane protein